MAALGSTPEFKGRNTKSCGFSTAEILISASAVTTAWGRGEKREREGGKAKMGGGRERREGRKKKK